MSNKEEVKRFFAELAPEIGLSLPGVIIEGGGIDADLETVIEFFTNAGFQEVEK